MFLFIKGYLKYTIFGKQSPKVFKSVAKSSSDRYPFLIAPDALLAPWRCRGAVLKSAMALSWRVHQKYEQRRLSATALPSALAAPRQRQPGARRGRAILSRKLSLFNLYYKYTPREACFGRQTNIQWVFGQIATFGGDFGRIYV